MLRRQRVVHAGKAANLDQLFHLLQTSILSAYFREHFPTYFHKKHQSVWHLADVTSLRRKRPFRTPCLSTLELLMEGPKESGFGKIDSLKDQEPNNCRVLLLFLGYMISTAPIG